MHGTGQPAASDLLNLERAENNISMTHLSMGRYSAALSHLRYKTVTHEVVSLLYMRL